MPDLDDLVEPGSISFRIPVQGSLPSPVEAVFMAQRHPLGSRSDDDTVPIEALRRALDYVVWDGSDPDTMAAIHSLRVRFGIADEKWEQEEVNTAGQLATIERVDDYRARFRGRVV